MATLQRTPLREQSEVAEATKAWLLFALQQRDKNDARPDGQQAA